ncbi:unnamed protein product [Musa hybrid cultivar]
MEVGVGTAAASSSWRTSSYISIADSQTCYQQVSVFLYFNLY